MIPNITILNEWQASGAAELENLPPLRTLDDMKLAANFNPYSHFDDPRDFNDPLTSFRKHCIICQHLINQLNISRQHAQLIAIDYEQGRRDGITREQYLGYQFIIRRTPFAINRLERYSAMATDAMLNRARDQYINVGNQVRRRYQIDQITQITQN